MLEGLTHSDVVAANGDHALLSVELDCCVIPLRNNLKLIQTTDFFYPLIDDPYTMGWITCCNVLSDLYAMGVVHCDNMLLLMGVPTNMTSKERTTSTALLMQGFRDCAAEAGTYIRGGQTVLSPWLMIGGAATSVCSDSEYVMPQQAEVGDVLVLTKPLGTQVAVNVHQWMTDKHTLWTTKLSSTTTDEQVKSLLRAATMSMVHLNRTAAHLMHKYGAHGCTDVTGFGLLGHANNLAKVQLNKHIGFQLHSLPYLAGCVQASLTLDDKFKVNAGLCPETSGGLLVILPANAAADFCKELSNTNGCPAWIVGDVIESDVQSAVIVDTPKIIEVEHTSIQNPSDRCKHSRITNFPSH